MEGLGLRMARVVNAEYKPDTFHLLHDEENYLRKVRDFGNFMMLENILEFQPCIDLLFD